MKRFFIVYQFAMPLALFPLAWLLWYASYGNHVFVLYVASMPVLSWYVVPAIGTSVTGLYEFDTKLGMGKFTPLHGFTFGAAGCLIAWLCTDRTPEAFDALEIVRAAFIMGSVLAFWNWAFDIIAVASGWMIVHNRQNAEGAGPEAVATDYAPVFFGVFGLVYGAAIRTGHYVFFESPSAEAQVLAAVLFNILCLLLPTGAFALFSLLKNGYPGLRRYDPARDGRKRRKPEPSAKR